MLLVLFLFLFGLVFFGYYLKLYAGNVKLVRVTNILCFWCADVKDGHYFLRILENEAVRLLKLADKAEEELDAGEGKLNENGKGFLRSAAGKARLLVSQKMQQFRGLCTNNLNQVGDFIIIKHKN